MEEKSQAQSGYVREIEIKYKRKRTDTVLAREPISGAAQVYRLFSDLQDEAKEKLLTLNLDAKNNILCFEVVCIGSVAGLYGRPMEVFRTSFPINAHGAIVVHNHPSGDPTPSKEDTRLTEDLLFLAQKMGLQFLDHVIIGRDGYYSFAEDGLL